MTGLLYHKTPVDDMLKGGAAASHRLTDGFHTRGNETASLQFDTVVENAILATCVTGLEGDEVSTNLQIGAGEVNGIEIMAAAVHGTAID